MKRKKKDLSQVTIATKKVKVAGNSYTVRMTAFLKNGGGFFKLVIKGSNVRYRLALFAEIDNYKVVRVNDYRVPQELAPSVSKETIIQSMDFNGSFPFDADIFIEIMKNRNEFMDYKTIKDSFRIASGFLAIAGKR